MAKFEPETESKINEEFLTNNDRIFVYPTNLRRAGHNNAHYDHLAKWTNSWGFLAYKEPLMSENPFFTDDEYKSIFLTQLYILKTIGDKVKEVGRWLYIFKMDANPKIWNGLMKPNIESSFEDNDHVIFLWEK